jgi:hypothetical protein
VFSLDLGKPVVAASKAGEDVREVTERFPVIEPVIENLTQYRLPAAKPHAGGRPPLLAPDAAYLREHLRRHSDTILTELRDQFGLSGAISTPWHHL